MTYTPPTPAERITEKLTQLVAFDDLAERITEYRDAEIRHARTQRTDDYLDTLTTLNEVLCILERGAQLDLCEQRMMIADEALNDCRYDMKEGCYVDHNGEPITPRGSFGGSHPDAGKGFRL